MVPPARRLAALIACLLALCGYAAMAQDVPAGSSPSKAKHNSEQRVKASHAPAESDEDVYRNSDFGFTYRVPYGWVDRTKEMQPDADDPAKPQLLLAVFERPPEVTGDTVNSAVIITAERAAAYPGLKTALDYMGPLTELTTGKGFKVTQEPYQFPVGTKQLVRGDFAKDLGKLTMYQSSLVLLHKGSVVSFTFIGGSEDEVEELIEKLAFGAAVKGR
jgi:hypothetical protein